MLYLIVFSIYIFFLLISLKDWRKGVVLWAAWRFVIGNPNLCLSYYPPAMTLDFGIDISLLFIFIIKGAKNKYANKNFPFKKIFWFYLFSYTISQFFSVLPIQEGLLKYVKFFIQNFGFLYLFFIAIKEKKYFYIFLVNIIVSSFVFTAYGIQEYFTHLNPLNDLVSSTIPQEILRGKTYYVEGIYENLRFGHTNIYSVFSIHGAYGCSAVIVCFLILQMQEFIKKKYFILLVLFLLISAFISNSKTAMLGAVMLGLLFLDPFSKRKSKNFVYIFVIVIAMLPITMSYLVNFNSLFDQSLAQESNGSSLALRLEQFSAAIRLFVDSPIWGYGIGAGGELIKKEPMLLGLESSLLVIPIERGVLGLVSYIYMWIFLYKYGKLKIGRWLSFCFIFNIVIMEAVAGILDLITTGVVYLSIIKYFEFSSLYEMKNFKKIVKHEK